MEEENEWEQYIMTYVYEGAVIKLVTLYLNLQRYFFLKKIENCEEYRIMFSEHNMNSVSVKS